MRPFLTLFGADPALDHLHPFETSWLLPPGALAALRALHALYIFFTIFFAFGWEGTHGHGRDIARSFSFFTWITFWSDGFYFLVAAIHSFCYARTGRSVIFDRLPRFMRALHSLFYTTITTFPFVVMIIYWPILYMYEVDLYKIAFDAWRNVSQHALPGVFALTEILLPTTSPQPLLHLPCLIVILLAYWCVAYISRYSEDFYVYWFLNPGRHGEHSGRVTGILFAIFGALVVVFAASWGLIWFRRRVTGGERGVKRSLRDPEVVYENGDGDDDDDAGRQQIVEEQELVVRQGSGEK